MPPGADDSEAQSARIRTPAEGECKVDDHAEAAEPHGNKFARLGPTCGRAPDKVSPDGPAGNDGAPHFGQARLRDAGHHGRGGGQLLPPHPLPLNPVLDGPLGKWTYWQTHTKKGGPKELAWEPTVPAARPARWPSA